MSHPKYMNMHHLCIGAIHKAAFCPNIVKHSKRHYLLKSPNCTNVSLKYINNDDRLSIFEKCPYYLIYRHITKT